MSITRVCQRLALFAILLFGCGGIAEEAAVDCAVFEPEVGAQEPVLEEPLAVAGRVDKFLSVNFNGSEVHIPDEFGSYRDAVQDANGESVCANSQANWVADCVVPPQARTVRFCFDQTACDAIGIPAITSKMNQAMWDFQAYLWSQAGWNASALNTVDSTCNVVLKCDDLAMFPEDVIGVTARSASPCWNIPGKNVCFMSGVRASYVFVQRIIDGWGPNSSGQWKTYNTALHELGHAMGFGHQAFSDIMEQGTSPGELTGPLAWETYERDALRDFNRDFDPCNWQPGDPVGAACPHEGP